MKASQILLLTQKGATHLKRSKDALFLATVGQVVGDQEQTMAYTEKARLEVGNAYRCASLALEAYIGCPGWLDQNGDSYGFAIATLRSNCMKTDLKVLRTEACA